MTRLPDIAVVGIGCRFPGGADSPRAFWQRLVDGFDAVRDVPPARWDADAFFDPTGERPGRMTTRRGAFVDGIDDFEPAFFGLSRAEAAGMDPQQRLLLEVAWEALEDAGIAPATVAGQRGGVFVGVSNGDHYKLLVRPPQRGGTGCSPSLLANRVSYFLDLRGPSLTIDTACSSSLVAIVTACDSLRAGASDVALAGGVNVMLAPEVSVVFSAAGLLAPDGRCKTFDADADGFVRGEGCGLIVLKRLDDALAAGDRVRAVIRGAAVNANGRGENGLTAPSAVAQEALVAQAIAQASIDPARVGLVEAHGTGTQVGDPIEVRALRRTYGAPRDDGSRCALASLKTNIGHLEAASGVAGLVKAVLCLENRAIPPHLHLRTPNPALELADTAFHVPTATLPWPAGEGPRLAAVSAYGLGGTNAHVILEEAPAVADERPAATGAPRLVPLSARTPGALRKLAARVAEHLKRHPDERLDDVAHTLAAGRNALAMRLVARVASVAELAEHLAAFARGDAAPGLLASTAPVKRPPRVGLLVGDAIPRDAAQARAARVREWLAAVEEAHDVARLVATAPTHVVLVAASEALEAEVRAAPSAALVRDDDPLAPARLFVDGAALAWHRLDAPGPHRRVELPTYPFEREPLEVAGLRAVRTPDDFV